MAWRTLLLLTVYSLGVYVGAGVVTSAGNILLSVGAIAVAALWLVMVLQLDLRSPGSSNPGTGTRRGPTVLEAPASEKRRPLFITLTNTSFVTMLLISALAGRLNGARALRAAVEPPLRAFGSSLIAAGEWPVWVEGLLASDAEPTEFGASLAIDVDHALARGERVSTRGGVRVSVGGAGWPHALPSWRAGRRVRVPVTLRGPQPYLDPGVPDQVRALALRGTTWLGSTKSAALVEVVERGSWPSEIAAAARAHARSAVASRMTPAAGAPAGGVVGAARDGERALPADALRAGIVIAVLIGDRAGIPWEVSDRLQRAGTFHVIAISGGNIAILAALALGVMRVSRAPPRLGAAAAALGLVAYGVVASGSASVTRATVVAVIYLSARVADVRANGFAVLWTAMLMLIAWSPLALFDAGFLLTCGATIGILLPGVALRRPTVAQVPGDAARRPAPRSFARNTAMRVVHGVARTLGAVTVATIAAELALLPIATSLFSRVTVAGLILNPIAIPLMGVAQISGLVIVVLGDAFPALGALAATCAHGAVHGLLWSATLVDVCPWLSWRVPPPLPAVVAAYYVSCAVALALSRVARRGWWIGAAVSAVACGGWIALAPEALPWKTVSRPPAPVEHWCSPANQHPGAAQIPPGSDARCSEARGLLTVVFFDVGQGDSVLLGLPDGRAVLVDAAGTSAGSSFDVGARVLGPALWALGVRRLHALVLTHGHPDHAGGAPAIVTDFRPRAVWEGIPVHASPELARVWRAAAAVGATRVEQYGGTRVALGSVTLDVVYPSRAEWERLRVRNDDSLALDVRFRRARVVLTGDNSAEVERLLAPRLRAAVQPAVTLLKVPHHGGNSASSPGLLQALRPDLAVVSAGRGNPFGHPAPATLARYKEAGIPVLRTDLHGAIAFVTDGDAAVASTWDGKRWMPQWRRP